MTAIAHDDDKLAELDTATLNAWGEYSERLRDLQGDEYERAEHESWTKLQGELRRLERRRRTLSSASR